MTFASLEILLVDDEPTIRLSLGDALGAAGHRVTLASDGEQALARLSAHRFDLVVTDIRLPKASGLQIFAHVREQGMDAAVILMTAYASVSDAVSALKEGAVDYLTKPFETDELLLRVARIAEGLELKRELSRARRALADCAGSREIIGNSRAIVQLRERVATIAASEANVLISGESGTGKELVARALHRGSARADQCFVAVNCAAFPESLLEAELFGHERGAFTGATKRREGRFRAAHRGTLLLDEVAEMAPSAQAKLLRVLQEGMVEPLGTSRPVQVDVRVLAATHQDLRQRVEEGSFRADLLYRLKVLDVHLPPLRQRHGDLPLLVHHFLARHAHPEAPVSPAAWAALMSYEFPGNVRELDHAIQHAVVLARGGEIDVQHLPSELTAATSPSVHPPASLLTLGDAIKEFERQYLLKALAAAGGKRGDAAEALGISRKNLWEKLKAHGISEPERDS